MAKRKTSRGRRMRRNGLDARSALIIADAERCLERAEAAIYAVEGEASFNGVGGIGYDASRAFDNLVAAAEYMGEAQGGYLALAGHGPIADDWSRACVRELGDRDSHVRARYNRIRQMLRPLPGRRSV